MKDFLNELQGSGNDKEKGSDEDEGSIQFIIITTSFSLTPTVTNQTQLAIL